MDLLRAIENSGFGIWVRESGSIWSYPTIIFLHSLGLSFVVGMSVALDLRIVGFAPRLPLKPLERLYPIMWFGFWLNAASGIALLIADATTMLINPVFYVKMTCVAGAIAVMVVIKRQLFASRSTEAMTTRAAIAVAPATRIQLVGRVTADGLDIPLSNAGAAVRSPDPLLNSPALTWQSKLLAAASLLLWAGAITAGRLTAYLGPVAGLKGQ